MFNILQSPEIKTRGDFGELCNRRGLVEAAEIGVDRGGFAVEFMTTWTGFTLLLIDPYTSYDHMPWSRDLDKATAIARMLPFADRVRFIPWSSPAAASQLPGDWHLNFVYIDADHRPLSVLADVKAWWDRLDARGILAGHDWVDIPHPNGVVKAVTEFARQRNLTIYTTSDQPASWYIYKFDPDNPPK